MLFSALTLPSLRCAAYVILSTEPVSHLALHTVDKTSSSDGDAYNNQDTDGSTEESLHLREEVSSLLEKLPFEALEMDLLAFERVSFFPFFLFEPLSVSFSKLMEKHQQTTFVC